MIQSFINRDIEISQYQKKLFEIGTSKNNREMKTTPVSSIKPKTKLMLKNVDENRLQLYQTPKKSIYQNATKGTRATEENRLIKGTKVTKGTKRMNSHALVTMNFTTQEQPINYNHRLINSSFLNRKSSNPLFKTILFTYQPKYMFNKSFTGFGDLIRASYYLLQFSEKINVEFRILIHDHPIKKYLTHFQTPSTSDPMCYYFSDFNAEYKKRGNSVIYYEYRNVDNALIQFLNLITTSDLSVHVYWINHPNLDNIKPHHRAFIRNQFSPIPFITEQVDLRLEYLNLEKQQFTVLHIRVDDTYFLEDSVRNSQRNKINFKLVGRTIRALLSKNETIIVLSNSNFIKKIIVSRFPMVKIQFHDIGHVCDEHVNDSQVINTLVDFYTMSCAKYIVGLSTYMHGSGFSKWCALTFQIPYVCYFIG